jgi:type IV secretory pathway VirJ component
MLQRTARELKIRPARWALVGRTKMHVLVVGAMALAGALAQRPEAAETLSFGRFGSVALYRETDHPRHVVLFVSGDGGWNQGVVDMARALASLDALVLGIDILHYTRQLELGAEACSYPAGDFEALSQFAQKKLGFASYVSPILVGYSSGATLAYAVVVQAPGGTFRGAISLGFCPDLPLTKPLCRGAGLSWNELPKGKGFSFLPVKELETPWIAFQGRVDKVCDSGAVEAFVARTGGARLVMLDKVGHGFSVQRNWMPQFRAAFSELAGGSGFAPAPATPAAAEELRDLPIVEIPASGAPDDALAVVLSGDGGWAGLDRDVAASLAADGLPVVGVDSLRYFWTRRTPEGAASDLARILEHYSALQGKKRFVLVGYSLGADVLPFLVNRLPPELSSRVALVALLGPGRDVDFEFHLTDWLGGESKSALPVLPEVRKMRVPKLLCVYGTSEIDSLCRELRADEARSLALEGAHHFGGRYREIASEIRSLSRE